MSLLSEAKMDKSHFSVVNMTDESDEKEYWASKTPIERLRAGELMRQMIYGYDPETARMEKVLTIIWPDGTEECLTPKT